MSPAAQGKSQGCTRDSRLRGCAAELSRAETQVTCCNVDLVEKLWGIIGNMVLSLVETLYHPTEYFGFSKKILTLVFARYLIFVIKKGVKIEAKTETENL